jgi:hypothetical protein
VALAAACSSGSTPASAPVDEVKVPAVNGISANSLLDCRGFKAELPEEIAPGARVRAAAPFSDTTSAFGDPPITVRCGVPSGSKLDDPYTFNGVAWAMHDNGASRLWTTLGRKVNVVVEVPDAYSSQAELIGRLSKPVQDNLS